MIGITLAGSIGAAVGYHYGHKEKPAAVDSVYKFGQGMSALPADSLNVSWSSNNTIRFAAGPDEFGYENTSGKWVAKRIDSVAATRLSRLGELELKDFIHHLEPSDPDTVRFARGVHLKAGTITYGTPFNAVLTGGFVDDLVSSRALDKELHYWPETMPDVNPEDVDGCSVHLNQKVFASWEGFKPGAFGYRTSYHIYVPDADDDINIDGVVVLDKNGKWLHLRNAYNAEVIDISPL